MRTHPLTHHLDGDWNMLELPTDAFHEHVEGEFGAELARILGDCARIDAEAASKGMFRSGRRLILLSDAYAQGIHRHRRAIFNVWATYIKPHLSSANATECRSIALAAFDKSGRAAIANHDQCITKTAAAINAERASASLFPSFLAHVASERRALESQAALHASLPMQPLSQQIVVNANGRYNSINVGSGSAHQTVHEGADLAALAIALGQLLAELQAQQDKADLTSVVSEAIAEARAPKPNKFKLSGLLNGMATGVQALGSAPSAWELVKAAVKTLGL